MSIPERWEGDQQCRHGHGKNVFLGLGWEGGGEKHGGGFLLFGKECILLSTDLYQWPCGTKQNGKK